MKTTHIIFGFAILSILVRFLFHEDFGFQRDEYLYLALGQHPGWGYWSNAPSIGLFSYLSQAIFGDSIIGIRVIPFLLGAATLVLTAKMCEAIGGSKFAITLTCAALLFSPSFLRAFSMYMPVSFNIFYWTLCAFLIVKWINTKSDRFLLFLGVTIGLGFMNKYSILFYAVAIFLALLATSNRTLFKNKNVYVAIGIAFIIVIPNLIWQFQNDFPVISHMSELSSEQLTHVSPINFLVDQFFFYLPALILWPLGVYYLLFNSSGKKYNVLGWIYIFLVLEMLYFQGKSYYILGAYPPLIAAGAVYFGQLTESKLAIKSLVLLPITIISLVFLPFCMPFLSVEDCKNYCQFLRDKFSLEMPMRWEDGAVYELPQDYADMRGWEELAKIVIAAHQKLDNPEQCIVYCENYGHASAVSYYGKKYGIDVQSFSDSFRMWASTFPKDSKHTLIYVNDNLGSDVKSLFNNVALVGEVETPYARIRGEQVYLCQNPKSSLVDFWNEQVQQAGSNR